MRTLFCQFRINKASKNDNLEALCFSVQCVEEYFLRKYSKFGWLLKYLKQICHFSIKCPAFPILKNRSINSHKIPQSTLKSNLNKTKTRIFTLKISLFKFLKVQPTQKKKNFIQHLSNVLFLYSLQSNFIYLFTQWEPSISLSNTFDIHF